MATHDYLIDDQTGANFRVDLNNVLAAIVSNNSNPTEPTTRFAYMWWADTTAGILKQRNSSNTAWVTIFNLTGISADNLVDGVSDSVLFNTIIGINAFLNNTTGFGNTAFGNSALLNNTSGNENTAFGGAALLSNLTAVQSTAFGHEALMNNTTGDQNTGLGKGALRNNTSGIMNTALGHNSASNITIENDTITVGDNVDSIGADFFTMGKGTGADRVYNQFTANATWTRASDKRIKKDIKTNEDCGLAFINALRTVTYKFKAPSELDPSLSEYDKDNDKPSHDKKMYGFIAQEVKEILDNHNIKDFAGWHVDTLGKDKLQGISYEMFVMPLVKSVQELSSKNQELVIENQDLSDRIDEQNAAIDDITNRLEAFGK